MTKAILVLEMPRNCMSCKLSCQFGSYCLIIGDTYSENGMTISENCPLKEIPYKMEQVYGGEDGSEELYEEMYMAGWNACIDEIVGGEE